jgi:uncharacterized surface protein with fasciclin (FAS1) repeats
MYYIEGSFIHKRQEARMKSLRVVAVFVLSMFMSVFALAANQDKQTITEIAVGNSDFSTLVAALQAADLAGVLNQPGEYTVFAPTNEAFAKLPAGTVENLLKPENKEQLTRVLLYHVVKGKVESADVKSGEVATLEGSDIEITVKNGNVMINDNAKVTAVDIDAANGVIHVIDSVLLPANS